jgi:hypothetical protein
MVRVLVRTFGSDWVLSPKCSGSSMRKCAGSAIRSVGSHHAKTKNRFPVAAV